MKKTNLFFTLVLFNISFACSQIENYPPIEDFDENLFSIEKVIDGIEIPWGLSFTSNNSFLVKLYKILDPMIVKIKNEITIFFLVNQNKRVS